MERAARQPEEANRRGEKLADGVIVERVLAGEVDAYRVLVERYHGAIFSCAYQHLHDREDAEEATQEAFVQGFEKLSRLRETRYFFSWMWRITSTVALKLRERSRRARLGLVDEAHPAPASTPEVELDERNQTLLHALSGLPEEQREVITLRFWHGMDYDEMSALLGVSHDALYQRASRGLRRLRELLGEDFLAE